MARRSAFTLLEILAVMSALVVVLTFGMAILAGALRVWHASAAAQNYWSHYDALADRFREDVRQATAVPERVEQWSSGPTCLILRAGGGHVIYQWQDHGLERVALPGEKTQRVPCGPEGTAVAFLRSGADQRVITLQLKLPHGGASRTQDISAALGGDLR